MNRTRLVSSVNIRMDLDDMNILREKAKKKRVPVSTYCRTKLTSDLIKE